VALVLAGGAAPGPCAGRASLEVLPAFAGAELHAGQAGDTLRVRVLARDAAGNPLEGVLLEGRPIASAPDAGALPDPASARTDARGQAELSFVLGRRGGDFVVLVSAPGLDASPVPARMRGLREDWGRRALLGVAGGMALFLYGMRLLGRGLEKAAGGRIRAYLSTMTASPLRSLVFGTVSTFLVQSSSASTVLLVSFASAGLVAARQCLAATLGAAVGSSFTVQLIAFRISDLSLLFVAIGFLLTTVRGNARRVGGILLGFGLLFFGLQLMSDAMAPLRGLPGVHAFLSGVSRDPVPALLAGALFTALVHTSAATLGILLSLAFQGLIDLDAALPLVFGANVGTATTAILASVGSNADGKRLAWAHAAFRLAGVLIFLPFLDPFAAVVRAIPGDAARQIANAHTLFGIATAALFLPFIPLADRLFRALIPDDRPASGDGAPRSLDPRFHEQPTVAIAGALQEVLRMGGLVREMLADVREALRRDDPALTRSIRERDDRVDRLDEQITQYLTHLSTEVLSEKQSERILGLFFVTKDLELIADIVSKGLVPGLLGKKQERDLRFSEEGFRQLLDFHDRVQEVVSLAVAAVATWDADVARQVLERKRELSTLERRMQIDHLGRLQAGNEQSRATTTVHVDALNDLKRIVSHAARIAWVVLGRVREPAGPPQAAPDDGVRGISSAEPAARGSGPDRP
jgi:phosphate:Na+ symporter